MKAIWKNKLQVVDFQTVVIPVGSKILCVQTQGNEPCIWFINPNVDEKKCEARRFAIIGTGHQKESIDGYYIGTFQLDGGALIFHLFEQK